LNLPDETAERYRFASVEVKQLAFRIDGVFLPDDPRQPIYFLEVQFQLDDRFYSRFFSEIFLYLHQTELKNNWRGAILYEVRGSPGLKSRGLSDPRRGVESEEIDRYEELLNSGRVSRVYLDELSGTESVGIDILKLITASESTAIDRGRTLIQQIRIQFSETGQQREILELIKTILVYKLPRVSRQEIEALFSLGDIKQTRVYQEALEECREEGREEGELAAKIASVPRLRALGLSEEQIASGLELDIRSGQTDSSVDRRKRG
jgi:predicted transposase/invertase (TIGR01784 family)